MPESKRATQPLCAECHHPKSFHGGGRCKALGCTSCQAYVPPTEPPAEPPTEPAPAR